MSKEKKVILTDIGGVIFKSQGIKSALLKYLNEEENCTKITIAMNLFYSTFTKNINDSEFWKQFSEKLNIKEVKIEEFFANLEYTVNYEYLDFLKLLSNKYTIGIISDINSVMYNFIKKHIKDFDEIFNCDYIFLSYILASSKFEDKKEFFNTVKNNIRISSKNIIYIDDSQENIDNALYSDFIGLRYKKEKGEIIANKEIMTEIKQIVGES